MNKFNTCDNCAALLDTRKIVVYCGDYTFCSDKCLNSFKNKHTHHDPFMVRPARDRLGEY